MSAGVESFYDREERLEVRVSSDGQRTRASSGPSVTPATAPIETTDYHERETFRTKPTRSRFDEESLRAEIAREGGMEAVISRILRDATGNI